MTEGEWLGSRDPQALLNYIRRRTSNRKLRLLVCACCRHIWHLLTDERSRQAVMVAERHADGLATAADLDKACVAAADAAEDAATVPGNTVIALAAAAADYSTWPLDDEGAELNLACEYSVRALEGESLQAAGATPEQLDGWVEEKVELGFVESDDGAMPEAMLCELIQEIFGNPYRPVDLDPAWLTPTVQDLALAIYEERAFDRLPILADALEDAGCGSTELLTHCRQPSQHALGCWALDLVLRKA
ncbi:MAG TPA: hypothetical protein VFA18_06105 [Gemmataceae bacterium]|nr:hypothetical protein [Gemmataceae bacterium]